MPFHYQIDGSTPEGRRTAKGLLALQAQLEKEVPKRTINDSLLLATWNIREFDSSSFGERTDESFHYIGEIISHFDLVAIQEVREDLKALDTLQKILGDYWKYVVTDVTKGAAGNRERMAFLFDSRKVRFSGIAGEVVLPPIRKGNKTYQPARQIARTPFLCGFRSGWFTFMLCTVHIIYGSSQANDPTRVEEISMLSKFLAQRARQKAAWSKNLILLGDFNIFSPQDVTFKAMTDEGFIVPQELQQLSSNAGKNKHYDQIAFRVRRERMMLGQAGIFDFYQSVFRDTDERNYVSAMGPAYHKSRKGKSRDAKGKTLYYRTYWRTHQMSDHLLMWVELDINFSKEFLMEKAKAT